MYKKNIIDFHINKILILLLGKYGVGNNG